MNTDLDSAASRLRGSVQAEWARKWLENIAHARQAGLILVLLIIAAGLSVGSPAFLTVENLLQVGRNSSEIGIMGLGMTAVLITGNVDLSVGALYAVGGITAGLVLNHTSSPVLAIASALLVGVAVGLFNGTLVGVLGLNSFMATLGTFSILIGALQFVSGGTAMSLPYTGEAANHVGTFNFLGGKILDVIQVELLFMLALVALMGLLFRNTTLGFQMYAVGGNAAAARIGGIRVPIVVLITFAISGVLAAFTGILGFSFVGSMDPTTGADPSLMFDVFAASVIGGASLLGGRGGAFGTLLGALFLNIVRNGFILMGVNPFAQTIAVGALIIFAIGLDRWVSWRQTQ